MNKGFGRVRPIQISLSQMGEVPLPGSTSPLKAIKYRGHPYVLIESLARILHKDIGHIERVATKQCPKLWKFAHGANEWSAICADDLMDIVSFEATDLENPYALKIYECLGYTGMEAMLDQAEAAGLDYIDIPDGKRLRFRRVNGERVVLADDLAEMLGISTEEIASTISSPEFASSEQHKQDMFDALGI